MKHEALVCKLAAAIAITTLIGGTATSQDRTDTSAGTGTSLVGLIDVVKVFKSHPRFESRMEDVKKEMETAGAELERQKSEIERRGQGMEGYKAGTPERKRLQEELLRLTADLQASARIKEKDLLEKEARIYYETYQEVLAEVAYLADKYNVSLVVRYDSDPIDPQDRGSVLKGVNRAVVFQRNRDLTNLVIEQLKARHRAGRPASGP